MIFEAELEPTLDDSIGIIVYAEKNDNDEYIFQFACNEKELLELRNEINIALKYLKRRKKLLAYYKTPEFWEKIRRQEKKEKRVSFWNSKNHVKKLAIKNEKGILRF